MSHPPAPDALFVAFQQALAGRYSLERELGRGGMGIVYLAREVRLDRLVAIKLLPPHLAAEAPLKDRFLREARTAARLSQPNIIPIFAVDEAGEFVFYVMAYVNGETLARRVARTGPLPPEAAIRVLREVAWALAYAHAQGVIHRDVKPENILLEEGSGRAMVADFGIARLTHGGVAVATGEVLGTPAFMSPEQAAGEAIDGRSDLYSLGVVGHYALTGRVPFDGPTVAAVMTRRLRDPSPRIATLAPATPPALAEAIDRCLATDPAARFASGEALAEALGAALAARPETPVAVRSFINRSKALIAVMFTAYVGLLPPLVSHIANLLAAGSSLTSYPVLFLLAAAALDLSLPPLIGLRLLRRLRARGYGPGDVALAVRQTAERRREEDQLEHGPAPTLGDRVLRITSASALGVAAVTTAGIFGGQIPALVWGVPIASAYVGLLTGAIALVRRQRRVGRGSVWARFWGGRIGGWLFRLAGIGQRAVPAGATGAQRPTEIAIGLATDALFAALPTELRRALGDLPETVRRLAARAQEVRGRIERLDRRAAEPDLRAARVAAEGQLAEIVTALETIRLDLLRLHAGAGSVAGVTADLTAAREIGAEMERLLQAGEEVGEALRPPPAAATH